MSRNGAYQAAIMDDESVAVGPDDPTAARLVADQDFRDTVIRTLWEIGGSACAGDLANELPEPIPASRLIPVLDSLVETGALKRRPEFPDCRSSDHLYQTVYSLAR